MDLEKLMSVLWKKYLETKDVKYLAQACEKAPFFGQKQWKRNQQNFKKLIMINSAMILDFWFKEHSKMWFKKI